MRLVFAVDGIDAARDDLIARGIDGRLLRLSAPHELSTFLPYTSDTRRKQMRKFSKDHEAISKAIARAVSRNAAKRHGGPRHRRISR